MKKSILTVVLFALLCPLISLAQKEQRYKIAVIDLMLLKRQKLGAIPLAKEIGADGLELDMGGLGNRPTFENVLANDTIRASFVAKAQELNLQFASLAMTGYYAQSFCGREQYEQSIKDCITTMQQLQVKTAFLPMGVQCDLSKNPERRAAVVERLKIAGKMAEAAGVVIGIETPLSAKDQLALLKEIGSPAIKIYFNFADALGAGRDLYKELKTLGAKNICQIHCTNKDGVWLQNDPAIDMYKVKKTLDKMKWQGWLVVERSRDATQPKNVKGNYGANVAFLKKIFQAP